MISRQQFDRIKGHYGQHASWAVWAQECGKPKSNIGDLRIFETPAVLEMLKPEVVMVGLNCATRPLLGWPFGNFHDPRPMANDYKIRYAFRGSEYEGAYMTDLIKSFHETDSKVVTRHVATHPDLLSEHLTRFRQELAELTMGASPLILTFGHDAYRMLKANLDHEEYRALIRLPHYSHRMSKEAYRDAVWKAIRASHVQQEVHA